MEVSGVKRSFVRCDPSPTPWAMSTDMARDCGSTARRLRDRRLRAVLWHQRLMAAVELTTVFRHRITTTECAGSSVDVGVQTSEQTYAITRLEGRPTLQTSCHEDFP